MSLYRKNNNLNLLGGIFACLAGVACAPDAQRTAPIEAPGRQAGDAVTNDRSYELAIPAPRPVTELQAEMAGPWRFVSRDGAPLCTARAEADGTIRDASGCPSAMAAARYWRLSTGRRGWPVLTIAGPDGETLWSGVRRGDSAWMGVLPGRQVIILEIAR